MRLIPVNTPILGKNALDEIFDILKFTSFKIDNGDVIVLAGKIVSYHQNKLIRLADIPVTIKAESIARQSAMDPQLVQLIINEADRIVDISRFFILTEKNGIYIPNAGIDLSNSPEGFAILWPEDPPRSAEEIRIRFKKEFGKNTGVIISDSCVTPGRKGTTGIAVAIAGFEGLTSAVGKPDIYGNPLRFTTHNNADELASAANFLMGEANESIPVVLIKDAEIKLTDRKANDLTKDLIIDKEMDLYRLPGR
jgi:coenzyme F420-0:L-glutamate ligase / coenzyme F420-1:gamma-L-glutamate ligase